MIDFRRTRVDIALRFAEEASKIASCSSVTGNPEVRSSVCEEFQKGLNELRVIVLEDELLAIRKSGEPITWLEVNDPNLHTVASPLRQEMVMRNQLQKRMSQSEAYTILLSHRPELVKVYVENGPFVGTRMVDSSGCRFYGASGSKSGLSFLV